jgi:FtsH-binding integral membrane protein
VCSFRSLSLKTLTGKLLIRVDKWIAIGICGESIVLGLLVIFNKIKGSLMGIMFFLYAFILMLTLGSILLVELLNKSQKYRHKAHRTSEKKEHKE